MRVTNEQIDAIRICHSQMSCSTCRYEKTLDDCDPTKEQIAADLLEARELIEEMRSFIEMLETLNSKEFNEHVRLLEKSKEYAE